MNNEIRKTLILVWLSHFPDTFGNAMLAEKTRLYIPSERATRTMPITQKTLT